MNNNSLFSHRTQEPEKSVLYIVSTPIGNLNDISIRAIKILKEVSLIACEDTRVTGKLLKHLKISNKLISYHKNNFRQRIPFLIKELKSKKSIALVSDAGTPLISDPGESLVKTVLGNDFDVISIPGASASLASLVCSGFTTSKFLFYGFIPKAKKEREELLISIAENKYTSIIYESPKKLKKLLEDLKVFCEGTRRIKAIKEITKRFEKHYGSDLNDLIEYFSKNEPKGEFTLVIEGNKKNIYIKDLDLRIELLELIEAGLSHSKASAYLSKRYSIPRKKIYSLILKENL
tara:strand:- start:934 stop:1806 length:873 start_codon:yes stop_codon:yes gene_type:complete